MRFYHVQPQQHYFCGIDLHTQMMYLCVFDQHGAIVLHKKAIIPLLNQGTDS